MVGLIRDVFGLLVASLLLRSGLAANTTSLRGAGHPTCEGLEDPSQCWRLTHKADGPGRPLEFYGREDEGPGSCSNFFWDGMGVNNDLEDVGCQDYTKDRCGKFDDMLGYPYSHFNSSELCCMCGGGQVYTDRCVEGVNFSRSGFEPCSACKESCWYGDEHYEVTPCTPTNDKICTPTFHGYSPYNDTYFVKDALATRTTSLRGAKR